MRPILSVWMILWAVCGTFSAWAADGQDAGYEWAEDNGVTNEAGCHEAPLAKGPQAKAFLAGCLEFVSDQSTDQDV